MKTKYTLALSETEPCFREPCGYSPNSRERFDSEPKEGVCSCGEPAGAGTVVPRTTEFGNFLAEWCYLSDKNLCESCAEVREFLVENAQKASFGPSTSRAARIMQETTTSEARDASQTAFDKTEDDNRKKK
jgi:hypothetical protein